MISSDNLSVHFESSNRNKKDRIILLLYHSVLNNTEEIEKLYPTENIFSMNTDKFEEQTKYLMDNGYNFININALINYLKLGKSLPDNPVLITFDDGWQSVYKNAYPILKANKINATIFLTTDKHSPVFYEKGQFDTFLTDQQIIEMSKNGIDFQSHGATHRDLSRLSEDELKEELLRSKEHIEQLTKKKVQFLSTPGTTRITNRIIKVAKSVGYEGIVCSLTGTNNQNTNPFRLRRLNVEGCFTLNEFVKNFEPMQIMIRRFISFLKKLPPKILTPGIWLPIRQRLFSTSIAPLFKLRNLKRLMFAFLVIIFLLFLYFSRW